MPDAIDEFLRNPDAFRAPAPAPQLGSLDPNYVARENARRAAIVNRGMGAAITGGFSGVAGYAYGHENQPVPKPLAVLNTFGGVVGGAMQGGRSLTGKALGALAGGALAEGGSRLGNFLGKMRYKATQDSLPYFQQDAAKQQLEHLALPTVAIAAAGMGAIANHAAMKALEARQS